MSTITVDNGGVVTVAFPGQPNESHIIQAPAGGKWTFLGNGTSGAATNTDGASGTPEMPAVFYDTNLVAWQMTVSDAGLLTVQSFDGTVVLAPCLNAPIKINGLPAVGYKLYAYTANTLTPATIYKNGAVVSQQTQPVVLNAYGLPTDPIFIIVGQYYKFVLVSPNGLTTLYTWDYLSGWIPTNLNAPTEWILPSVTATDIDAGSFTVKGDARSTFTLGRRVQCVSGSTLYGTVTSATYDGTTTLVAVALDSGALANSLSTVAYALQNPASSAIPDRRSVGTGWTVKGDLTVPTALGLNLIPAALIDLRTSAPTGWLACNGASLLRASYPALFTAIGTTFGAVDGTHFTLPTIAAPASLVYCIYAQV